MPEPEPRVTEDKKEFLDRCMSDEQMIEDYPDSKQRLAVCHDLWKENK